MEAADAWQCCNCYFDSYLMTKKTLKRRTKSCSLSWRTKHDDRYCWKLQEEYEKYELLLKKNWKNLMIVKRMKKTKENCDVDDDDWCDTKRCLMLMYDEDDVVFETL